MSEEEQIANLLVLMGSDSVLIYEQFSFNEDDPTTAKTLDNTLKLFDAHFEPVRNVIFERVKFNSMKQGNTPIHQFITQLQTQADKCEYGNMRDVLVRDRIVVGVQDEKLRNYLIDIDDLDLGKCITKAKQYLSHHAQAKVMSTPTIADPVDVVKSGGHRRPPQGRPDTGSSQFTRSDRQSDTHKLAGRTGGGVKCKFCNKETHPRERCPARKSECRECHQHGHWARSAACTTSVKEVKEEFASEEVGGLFLERGSE